MNKPPRPEPPKVELSFQNRVEIAVKHSLRRLGIDIKRIQTIPLANSETSACRVRLAEYCMGNGVDLGPGGDPILPTAVRIDLPQPYMKAGTMPVQFGGDAQDLYWFTDNCLDYVYSSHLLEDFEDIEKTLREWLRVLKINGNLIIYCPDEQRYRLHCQKTAQDYNFNHVHDNFSLEMVKAILLKIGNTTVLHEDPEVGNYSWEIVAKRTS